MKPGGKKRGDNIQYTKRHQILTAQSSNVYSPGESREVDAPSGSSCCSGLGFFGLDLAELLRTACASSSSSSSRPVKRQTSLHVSEPANVCDAKEL